jgi:predicted SAM-dependent methyltransferase
MKNREKIEINNILCSKKDNEFKFKKDLNKKIYLKKDLPLLNLEIASGNKPKEGFIHFDLRKDVGADITGDARDLPFADETFNLIYSRFLLEHLPRMDALIVLEEVYRVLKKGGTFEIIVPNLAYFCELFIKEKGQLKEWALNKIYGFEKYGLDHHFFGYDEEILIEFLKKVKFSEVNRINDEEQFLHLIAKK